MNKFTLLLVVISFQLNSIEVKSQNLFFTHSTIVSSGVSFSNTNYYVRGSIGQVIRGDVYRINDHVFRNGFQQPVFPPIAYNKPVEILSGSVFPNPSNGNFKLRLILSDDLPYQFKIFSSNLVAHYEGHGLSGVETNIDLSNFLPNGLYYVMVYSGKSFLKAYKVIIMV